MIFTSLCAVLLSFGLAFVAGAGSSPDADSDGVPDSFDNCTIDPNGPLLGACTAQENADGDANGDACDADYDNDNIVAISDFSFLLGVFGTADPEADSDCDGVVAISDFSFLLGRFGLPPGPP
jgi:hypothetical protein